MSDDEYCEFHDNGDGDGLVDDEDHHHHEEVFKVQTLCGRRGRWPDRPFLPPIHIVMRIILIIMIMMTL